MTAPFNSHRRRLHAAESPAEQSLFLRFTSNIRPHAFQVALGLGLALAGTAGTLATPWVAKVIIDDIINNAPILLPVLVLALLMLGTSVLAFMHSIVLGFTAEKIVYKSRTELVSVLLRAPVGQLRKRSVGELVTRATSDTTLLREATSISLVGIVNAAIMCIGIVVLMYLLDPVLLVVTVLAFTMFAVILWVVVPLVTAAQYRVQQALGQYGAALEATLAAIRTVKAAQAETHQQKVIDSAARSAQRHSVVSVKLNAFAWAAMTASSHIGVIVVLAVGAWRLKEGSIDVSTLVAFVLYATALGQPIAELGEHLPRIQSGIAALRRMDEILTITPEQREAAAPSAQLPPVEGAPLIEFKSVDFCHENAGKLILSDACFGLPNRGHYAIIGESGVGKTTLIGLVMAFTAPDSGSIYLNGLSYANLGVRAVRDAISYVEQDCPLVAGTIRDNLLLGDVTATDDEILGVLQQLRLGEFIDGSKEGLDRTVNESTVSAGQRQRLAIARGILRPSRVLILDEPTAHLDAEAEKAVVDCLEGAARTRAVLTVSHRDSTVARADVVFTMQDGKLVPCRPTGAMAPSNGQLVGSALGRLMSRV
jgi:ABC-type multidrug transport system fused ATPase/permease subunit